MNCIEAVLRADAETEDLQPYRNNYSSCACLAKSGRRKRKEAAQIGSHLISHKITSLVFQAHVIYVCGMGEFTARARSEMILVGRTTERRCFW